MYSLFLSYAPLQEYLSILLEKGLIEEYQKELEEKEKEKQQRSSYYYYYYYYKVTDKGRRFLLI